MAQPERSLVDSHHSIPKRKKKGFIFIFLRKIKLRFKSSEFKQAPSCCSLASYKQAKDSSAQYPLFYN